VQAITAPMLISTIRKLPQHPLSLSPVCCVFTSRSMATASDNEDSSASRAQVLSSQISIENWLRQRIKLKVTLRVTVSQSVSLGVEHHFGLITIYLLLFDSYDLFSIGRPLWREDGSVFCICCWPLPAQCFSSTSPLVLATIFYCLWFETSLFVASYDSQGHGGGIRPRLRTGHFS
jgi:hypothetical protein